MKHLKNGCVSPVNKWHCLSTGWPFCNHMIFNVSSKSASHNEQNVPFTVRGVLCSTVIEHFVYKGGNRTRVLEHFKKARFQLLINNFGLKLLLSAHKNFYDHKI